MRLEKDPVCGMNVDPDSALEGHDHGHTYHFCSVACLERFNADPGTYSAAATGHGSDADDGLERHDPPYTDAGGLTAPKFGSATSGGAEYERLPEQHDRKDT
jgi:YHS domain-containing protein